MVTRLSHFCSHLKGPSSGCSDSFLTICFSFVLILIPSQVFPQSVSFPTPRHFPLLGVSITSGDFNGDGILDIVVANNSFLENNVWVALGDGKGGLGPISKFPVQLLPTVVRSEEHTSELQSHSFISYAVF